MSNSESPWRPIDPPEWAKPVGYSNAIESRGGRRIALAGQVAMAPDGSMMHPGDLVAQADQAFANIATVLRTANAKPEHLVRMRIYVLDAKAYATHAREIGGKYRDHFGRWFPAMTLIQIAGFYEDGALIEVETDAVVPDAGNPDA